MKNTPLRSNLFGLPGKIFFILLSSFIFVNCEEPPVQQTIQFDKKTFNQKWAAWEAQGLGDYSVREKISSWGPTAEVRIVVQDNVIIQKEALSKWTLEELKEDPNYKPWEFREVKTISELYAMIITSYNERVERLKEEKNEPGGMRGIKVEITYNENYHYPEYIYMHDLYDPGEIPLSSTGFTIWLTEFMPLASE